MEITLILTDDSRDWVAIIVNALIPLVVMLSTLIFERHCQKKAIKQQKEEHSEILAKQDEANRINIMPVFDVTHFSGIIQMHNGMSKEIKEHVLDIRIKNVGNGVAMGVNFKWIELKNSNEIIDFPVCENKSAIYTCYKEFQYENAVAPVGSEVSAQLIRRPLDEDENNSENNLCFTLRYFDLNGIFYEQAIIIKFYLQSIETGEIKPFDIMALPPQVCNDAIEDLSYLRKDNL